MSRKTNDNDASNAAFYDEIGIALNQRILTLKQWLLWLKQCLLTLVQRLL